MLSNAWNDCWANAFDEITTAVTATAINRLNIVLEGRAPKPRIPAIRRGLWSECRARIVMVSNFLNSPCYTANAILAKRKNL
jgi:hypothetical protein